MINGVICFQRNIDNFIAKHNLQKTYAYLENVTVAGSDQEEHDLNLSKLLAAYETDNLKLTMRRVYFLLLPYAYKP